MGAVAAAAVGQVWHDEAEGLRVQGLATLCARKSPRVLAVPRAE